MSAGLKEGERGIIFDGDRLDHQHHQQHHHQDNQQHHDNHADHIKLVQVMLAILGLCSGFKLLPLLLFLHGDPHHIDASKDDEYVGVGGVDGGYNDSHVTEYYQVNLLVQHHLWKHEADQDASSLHRGECSYHSNHIHDHQNRNHDQIQVEFKGMDIVKHGESAYPAQVIIITINQP